MLALFQIIGAAMRILAMTSLIGGFYDIEVVVVVDALVVVVIVVVVNYLFFLVK